VDNQVAYFYLLKGGGRLPHLNSLMRDFWTWCLKHHITVKVHWVKSQDDQADRYTRLGLDTGDYTLHHGLFCHLRKQMLTGTPPLWDMFASPGNHKFPLFCARYPHWKAKKVDALTCPLDDIQLCYSNHPWNLIAQWLSRLRSHPHLTCWVIVPFWASAPWWPLLTRLQVPKSPCYKILPFPGMFTNCANRSMPPPGGPCAR
jgi:hypothetical protein